MKTIKNRKKKGQLTFILPAFLAIGIAIIGISMVSSVLGGIQTAQCSGTIGVYNYTSEVCCALSAPSTVCNQTVDDTVFGVTNNGLTGMGTINNFWSPIVLVVIAVVIIGLLGLFGRGRQQGL